MSSVRFVCRLQAHADVKLPDMSSAVGTPNAARAKVHSTIAPPALETSPLNRNLLTRSVGPVLSIDHQQIQVSTIIHVT